MSRIPLTVFTKPWTDPMEQLADKVAALGLDGVELAVRPGYQVTPETIRRDLPKAARILESRGLMIGSVATPLSEDAVAACGEAGVGILRTMAPIDLKRGFAACFDDHRRSYDALIPALDRHNVRIGVQNHYGNFVGSVQALLYLIEPYDPRHVCAVFDMAHCGVAGEPLELAVDVIWPRLNGLVNFKSAFQKRINGPEEAEARFAVHWTTARHGAYSWSHLVKLLTERNYAGMFCLPAEYSDPAGAPQRMGDDVLPFLREDIAYIKSLGATA
jgi:sugar phosphate isomerase/epimerase